MLLNKLEQMSQRFQEVNELILDPELTKDPKKYKDIMREHSHLSTLMEAYTEYKEVLKGIEESKILITEEDDHDMKEMAREELKSLEERLPVLENNLKMLLIPPDPLEEKNIIMEMRGGTGGDESSLFAADLFRMYTRYADSKVGNTKFWKQTKLKLVATKKFHFQLAENMFTEVYDTKVAFTEFSAFQQLKAKGVFTQVL